jgi:hypothetical protein
MAQVKLEFENLQILRNKGRWNLYFIIVAQHPTDDDKMIMTSMPEPYIRIKPRADNMINFVPEGIGANGFFVMKRSMPDDRHLNVGIYLRHSRNATRSAGAFLTDMKGQLGIDAFDVVADLVGNMTPWLVVSKNALQLIGGILTKLPDRDFGMMSMSEQFGPEFDEMPKQIRSNIFTTGDARLTWSWIVEA